MDAQSVSVEDTVEVHTLSAACEGMGETLGHPRVYLDLGAKGEVTCPYCSRHFILSGDAPKSGGH